MTATMSAVGLIQSIQPDEEHCDTEKDVAEEFGGDSSRVHLGYVYGN